MNKPRNRKSYIIDLIDFVLRAILGWQKILTESTETFLLPHIHNSPIVGILY